MVAYSDDCRCSTKGFDPYEKPLRYIYGAHQGKCINSCKYRYAKILNAQWDSNSVEVSNLFHLDRFWTARIPLGKIKNVEIFFENFSKSFNHVAFQFHFEQGHPVQLELQDPSLPGPTKMETMSLIVSPEGIPPGDGVYNLTDGLMGHYALMYRIYSGEQYEVFQEQLGYTLRFYKAQLNEHERRRLLALSLAKSAGGTNGVYQLIFNNCATASIDLILDSKHQLVSESWDIWDILDPLRGLPLNSPIGTLSSLKWWGLIDTSNKARLVEPKSL